MPKPTKPETFDAAAFNRVFSEGGLPECANCRTQQEVLNAVAFALQRVRSLYRKLEAVKEASDAINN